MNKRMIVMTLCVLAIALSMIACGGDDNDGCTFYDGSWHCDTYDSMMDERNPENNKTAQELYQEQVKALNERVSEAANNASWGNTVEVLDQAPEWTDEEKNENYQDARNVATDNQQTCGYWGGYNNTQWIETSCNP